MKRVVVSLVMCAVLVGLVGAAQAGEEKKGVKVGSLKCVFSPAEKGAKAVRFTGTIKKYGVDLGYQKHAVLLWGVLSTSAKVTPGEIAGTYGGVTAEAAWAAGAGANVLVGRSKKGIALQPLSVEGYPGANVAAGVVEVELKQAK